jgi:hypothetical protein
MSGTRMSKSLVPYLAPPGAALPARPRQVISPLFHCDITVRSFNSAHGFHTLAIHL